MSWLGIVLIIGFIVYVGFKTGSKSRGNSSDCWCNDDD